MSGEEGELESRHCSFQNLVSERKEKKVTRGGCKSERRTLLCYLKKLENIFLLARKGSICSRREDDSWMKIVMK